MKKQEAKKVANPLFEKKFQNFSTGQGIQPKRDFTDFITWSHYTQLQWQRAILYKRLEVLLWLTSLPRPWTTKELLSCLSWPGSADQRKQDYWPGLWRKQPGKGNVLTETTVSPLSFECGLTLPPSWWKARSPYWWWLYMSCIPSIWLLSCLPFVIRWGSLLYFQREGQSGASGPQSCWTTQVTWTQVNSENEGFLANILEATRRPITMTDLMRSFSGGTTLWVQNLWLPLPSWKR